MADTKHDGKVRLGIVGLDHWYIGLDAARAAAAHPDVDLIVVAHRDAAWAQETAERFGAAEATGDYAGVASRDDPDVVVTACRTGHNAALGGELAPGLEDFGLAALAFGGEQVASLEVTWTGAPGAHIMATHIVGSDGAIVLDPTAPGRATVSGRFEPFSGWCTVPLPDDDRDPVARMVTALRDDTSLPAGVAAACRTLDVCLTFYEAARAGCTKEVSP